MQESALLPLITIEQACNAIRRRVPRMNQADAELKYHPFSGFAYRLHHRGFGKMRCAAVHTLVDRYTGKAYISDAWTDLSQACLEQASKVSDPQWNTVSFEQARERSAKLMRTANLRRYRLSGQPRLEEVDSVKLIWKPNWLVTCAVDGRTVKVLVDGLTSQYYVLGS